MIGFIGAGNMGGAILKGAIEQSFLKAEEVMIYDVSPEAVQAIQAKHAVKVAQGNVELAQACDTIVLAVKPIYLGGVAAEIRKHAQGKQIISIAAGWSVAMLKAALGDVKLLRVMPNTPALVGAGFTALCEETTFDANALQWAVRLFETLGVAQVLPERLFDAVVAVSGSSPAYVFMMIDAMADAAVKLGMPRKLAIQAAAQAVYGSAKMVLETGEHPDALKDNVCSPGGTTIDAVQSLEESGFRGALIRAMVCCAEKNRRMGEEQSGGKKA